VKLVATSLVAAALMLASTQVATPSPAAAPLVVKATISPSLIITFSPKTFRHGKVAIKVMNQASAAHQFAVNGVSAYIKPQHAVVVTVTFKRRGVYTATLADCGYPPCMVNGDEAGSVGTFVKVT
jgi:hypothetical protein